MRAVILANGELGDPAMARVQIRAADWLICADGGMRHARSLDLWPQVVIGDLDSLDEADRAALLARGCQLLAYPAHKDETDLELALVYAAGHGATEIIMLGTLGGRWDQSLANILLLAHPALLNVDARIVAGLTTIRVLRGGETGRWRGAAGDTISLLPLSGDVTGITTAGLAYPLQDDTLHLALARGVSNMMTADEARVQVGAGILLVVHSR
ncbi:MAG: thiamine diphosphokinase [Chloroflexi bacterium]|nr:thiamine diphosphokinase [Chloroflexota bacterium]MBU1749073.1 thiamine diphosphokinase [Chloroflexota bacterium]MBU1879788.1 thiamine diphosphokinase [Chloroflexota bacterium]